MTSYEEVPKSPSKGETPRRFLRESGIAAATFAAAGALCSILLALLEPPMNLLALGLGAAVAGTVGVFAWWLICGGPRRYSTGRCIAAGVVASLLGNPGWPLAMIVVQTGSLNLDILIPYALTFLIFGWFTLPAAVAASLVCRTLVIGRPPDLGEIADDSEPKRPGT